MLSASGGSTAIPVPASPRPMIRGRRRKKAAMPAGTLAMHMQLSTAKKPGWRLAADQPPPALTLAPAPARPLRVLVVEDEMLIALGLELTVQGFGHRVCALAATAEEAVAEAGQHRPDIVLMDICLGQGSNGIAAACEIRRRFDIPAIFISASLDSGTAETAQAARPLGFIAKPFTPDRIGRALAEVQVAGPPKR